MVIGQLGVVFTRSDWLALAKNIFASQPITCGKMVDHPITCGKMVDHPITCGKMVDHPITCGKMVDHPITCGKMVDHPITCGKMVDHPITCGKMVDHAVTKCARSLDLAMFDLVVSHTAVVKAYKICIIMSLLFCKVAMVFKLCKTS